MSNKMINFDGVKISEDAILAKGFKLAWAPAGTEWRGPEPTVWRVRKVLATGSGADYQYQLRHNGPDGEWELALFSENTGFAGASLAGLKNIRDMLTQVLKDEGYDDS